MCVVNRRYIWLYGRSTLFFLRPWLPVRIRNAHMAVEYPGSIVVCNHQSFLDIYLLAAQDQANVCLITKSWPFRLLFFFAPTMGGSIRIPASAYALASITGAELLMQARRAKTPPVICQFQHPSP